MDVKSLDTHAPVKAIGGVLNKHKIPIALVPSVFEAVLRDINANTIPYSPSCFSINDLAMSDMTEKVTVPKG